MAAAITPPHTPPLPSSSLSRNNAYKLHVRLAVNPYLLCRHADRALPDNSRHPAVMEDLHGTRQRDRSRLLCFHRIEDVRRRVVLSALLGEQSSGEFVVTLWRDWLTDTMLTEIGLNERQKRAIQFVKENGRINNTEYQDLVKISMRNASRDLTDLVKNGIFEKRGIHGKGVHYVLGKKARKAPEAP